MIYTSQGKKQSSESSSFEVREREKFTEQIWDVGDDSEISQLPDFLCLKLDLNSEYLLVASTGLTPVLFFPGIFYGPVVAVAYKLNQQLLVTAWMQLMAETETFIILTNILYLIWTNQVCKICFGGRYWSNVWDRCIPRTNHGAKIIKRHNNIKVLVSKLSNDYYAGWIKSKELVMSVSWLISKSDFGLNWCLFLLKFKWNLFFTDDEAQVLNYLLTQILVMVIDVLQVHRRSRLCFKACY